MTVVPNNPVGYSTVTYLDCFMRQCRCLTTNESFRFTILNTSTFGQVPEQGNEQSVVGQDGILILYDLLFYEISYKFSVFLLYILYTVLYCH